MAVRSWIRSLFARRTPGTVRKARPRQLLTVETLEDRTLLDSSLSYQAVANTPLTLRQAGNELQVVDSTNNSVVLASELVANITGGVRIAGDHFDVALTVDAT